MDRTDWLYLQCNNCIHAKRNPNGTPKQCGLAKRPRVDEEQFLECAKNIPASTEVEKAAAPWIFGAKLIKAQREAAWNWIKKYYSSE